MTEEEEVSPEEQKKEQLQALNRLLRQAQNTYSSHTSKCDKFQSGDMGCWACNYLSFRVSDLRKDRDKLIEEVESIK